MSELHASSPVLEAQNGDHDEEERWQPPTQGRHVRKGTECPYLDTISRQVNHPCRPGTESLLCILSTLNWCLLPCRTWTLTLRSAAQCP